MKTYEDAFHAYVKGDWVSAKTGFEKVLDIKSDDKPTQNLYDFMGQTNYVAPEGWKGYKFFNE